MRRFHTYFTIFFTFILMVVSINNGVLNALSLPQRTPTSLDRDNNPPLLPNITGPHAGAPDFELTYIMNATDPDGDQILLKVDWDDGNMTDWLGPVNSTTNITTHHAWASNGNYIIRVQVKDSHGLQLNQTVPYNLTVAPQLTLTNLKSGFIYLLNSFFYVGMLDVFGAVILMSVDHGLVLNFSAASTVAAVYAVATSIRTSQNTEVTDDNATDGFTIEIPIATGLFQIGYLAYDAEGNIIDGSLLNYLLFIKLGTMATTGLHSLDSPTPAHARTFI